MTTETLGSPEQNKLKSYVERIENLEAEKAALGSDITELYREAGSIGFDVKALREVIKLRKLDREEREEREGYVATYMHALEGTGLTEASVAFAGLPRNDTKPLGIDAQVELAREEVREDFRRNGLTVAA